MNPKARLRKKGLRKWFEVCYKPQCELCGNPTKDVHHFFLKSDAGWLMFDPDNAVSLCIKCHTAKHWRGDPRVDIRIKEVKGKIWYDRLTLKRNTVPKPSYKTIKWLKSQIDNLEKYNAKRNL